MTDQRGAQRVNAQYYLEYSLAGRIGDGVGRAIDLSETGLRFIAPRELEPGSHVTVRVPARKRGTPVLTAMASVVRCRKLEDGSGFAIGCAYD